MPFSEKLADRIREIIAVTHTNVEEKKMFAGLCFMVRGFVFVNDGVLKTKKQLEYWVRLGLDYNQFAKSSKMAPKKVIDLKNHKFHEIRSE